MAGMKVLTASGTEANIDDSALQKLSDNLRGQLLRRGDAGYDSTRAIWNGMIDRRPSLIAQCVGAADVAHAVRFAREGDMVVSVRGGGHGVAGAAVCDGGLMIDLSQMRGVWVDPKEKTARAQAGALWGDFDAETGEYGLHTTGGIVTHTGIAGLTLGGGIGWLMRKHGLTIDNVASFNLVTAEGEAVRASAEENPDLFWGLRGGGGNFGVVTSFEYRLHEVAPQVLAGVIVHPADDATNVLRYYRDFIADSPGELMTILNLRKAPAAPFLPEEVHGVPAVIIAVCYSGAIEEGERVLEPLRRFGQPLADVVRPGPYTAHQALFDASVPHGQRYYMKAEFLDELSNQAIDALVRNAWTAPSEKSYTVLFQMGGALRAAADDESAFVGRQAHHAFDINSVWTDPSEDERQVKWARDFWTEVQPYSAGSVYVNFLGDEGEERVRAAYGAKYDKLVALKTKYDPTNFFRMNQNIKPSG
jgi:FAD/FMN-containing dehydrogenase